jgi:hypothetical protein
MYIWACDTTNAILNPTLLVPYYHANAIDTGNVECREDAQYDVIN